MASEINMTHVPVFEKLGESQVRMQFAERSDDVGLQAREWLKLKELERAEASSAKRDAREESTLSIAKRALAEAEAANSIAREQSARLAEANSIARKALVNSRYATAIAMSAIIWAIGSSPNIWDWISGIIFKSPK